MEEKLNKEIGEKIRKLREDKGLTLREAGEAIGVDFSHLGRIERGNAASMKVYSKILDYFGKDITYLFGEKGELPKELAEIGVEWIAFAKEMKERNLTPDEIKAILNAIKKLNTD